MSFWNTGYPFTFEGTPPYYVPYSIRFAKTMGDEYKEILKYITHDSESDIEYRCFAIKKNTGSADLHYFLLYDVSYESPNTVINSTMVVASTSAFSFKVSKAVKYDSDPINYEMFATTYSNDSTYTYDSKTIYYKCIEINQTFNDTGLGNYFVTDECTKYTTAQQAVIFDNANYFAWLTEYNATYTNDPYNRPPQGDAPRGGNGNWDISSDTIEVDPLPAGLWGQGFVSVYVPTVAELASFASEIWDSNNRTLFNDIFPQGVSSGIIDCFTIPVQPDTTTGANICMGGEVIANTHSAILANRFKTVDFGNITGGNTGEHFGAFPDYMSTKIAIYLPYIGWEELAPEMVINASINLQYRIDCLTGDFVAIITTTRHDDKFDFEGISYTFNGNCSSKIPITSQTGAGAHDYVSSAISGLTTIAGGAMTGNPIAVAGGTVNMVNSMLAMNDKHTFSLKGGFTGSKGQLSPQRPYLVINRPVMENGANNNYFNLCGAPSNDYVTLSACVGESPTLTKVFECTIDNNNFAEATEQEKTKIYNLLKSGVIL